MLHGGGNRINSNGACCSAFPRFIDIGYSIEAVEVFTGYTTRYDFGPALRKLNCGSAIRNPNPTQGRRQVVTWTPRERLFSVRFLLSCA